ncbi:multifunctional CCA addition/repair protein [Legionella londiniensis]|uniref:Multifunctional CCA protein n=1 Tax=Legionella londiniensis TaxID=45068 RepID=A0A0W0VSG7_9GAMM|nr:multifunctional CCA addition/repair protein [Legionella londiniensis]KTD23067.1 tRNA nucleotidyltransferase [Legionella londiniensis]STX94084.1 tRNA nucleotidyltransferase [Legionella londiniensis]
MKVYLVGGAVRDQLLGYPVKERDWVIVGATPEEMAQKGYQQVGRDFPVFLHPKTREEYALARTERKKGHGYHGFSCHYEPDVTLEEDLARRDLTINAMAKDERGNLIDPYHGLADLKAKILRHVSPSFVEDPVRVLRIARFKARYQHLGFTLAEETRALMYAMVKKGELDYLVPERVWQEWQRSLEEKNPEAFISTLRACGALEVILPELDSLFGVPNPKKHHPEIDSGVHTLLALQEAVKLCENPVVRFAALVHDLGKAKTPMHEWPSHHRHEQRGLEVISNLCQRLRIPADYRKLALLVSRYHLDIHRLLNLRASTVVKILEETDAFRRPGRFEQILLACEADKKGKVKKPADYPLANYWRFILKECAGIQPKSLIDDGYEGKAIKVKLHELRIKRVQELLESRTSWEKTS